MTFTDIKAGTPHPKCIEITCNPLLHEHTNNLLLILSRESLPLNPQLRRPSRTLPLIPPPKPTNKIRNAQAPPRNNHRRPRKP